MIIHLFRWAPPLYEPLSVCVCLCLSKKCCVSLPHNFLVSPLPPLFGFLNPPLFSPNVVLHPPSPRAFLCPPWCIFHPHSPVYLFLGPNFSWARLRRNNCTGYLDVIWVPTYCNPVVIFPFIWCSFIYFMINCFSYSDAHLNIWCSMFICLSNVY